VSQASLCEFALAELSYLDIIQLIIESWYKLFSASAASHYLTDWPAWRIRPGCQAVKNSIGSCDHWWYIPSFG